MPLFALPTRAAELLIPVKASQDSLTIVDPNMRLIDSIYMTSGRVYVGTVSSVTSNKVFYTPENMTRERSIYRRNVHRIRYANGRSIKLNDMAVQSISDDDYRIVMVTENPDDVKGLYALGKVHGESSKGSTTRTAALRSAETRMKKRAVAKKAIYVLLTKRTRNGGFGEVPTYYMEGEAYGTEPPETAGQQEGR